MTNSEDPASDRIAGTSPAEHSSETAEQLREVVIELATGLRPFPAFMGMNTLQAIELELPVGSGVRPPPELGCVVVMPNGEISEVDLKTIPGAYGPAEVEQVEQFTELDCSPEQYIAYATVAVQLLQGETQQRGGSE